MKQAKKDWMVLVGLLLLKALGTFRMAADTYVIAATQNESMPWLSVTLIDVAFFVLWAFVAYGGESAKFRTGRPWATLVVWVIFLFQMVIGWQSAELVGLASRVIVGGLLALDTWTYLADLWKNLRTSQGDGVSLVEWRRRIRHGSWQMASVLSEVLVIPVTLVASIVVSGGSAVMEAKRQLEEEQNEWQTEQQGAKPHSLSPEHKQKISDAMLQYHAGKRKQSEEV